MTSIVSCNVPEHPAATAVTGLTGEQVAARRSQGKVNVVTLRTSRPVSEILRANVLTFFNGLLLVLFLLVIATGRWQNSLFGGVIVANSGIGVFQELRAKRVLDRLAVLNVPQVRVVRDGQAIELAAADIVLDKLVVLSAGDQMPADGTVIRSDALEVDESLLSGESEPVVKAPGDAVRSGSIVVAGSGSFQATAVGPDAYASKLANEARRFTTTRSELVDI